MNCESVSEKLSAYLDGELSTSDELSIRGHLDSCESCRLDLEQFIAIGGLIRRTEAADEHVPAWEAFEHQVDGANLVRLRRPLSRSTWVYGALATAASFGLLWLAVSNMRNSGRDEHEQAGAGHVHDSLAVDFGEFFQSAQSNPKSAIGRLVAKYQGKELDRTATIDYLGYEPALFQSLPVGFTRTSTHVLNMPCCRCSATICQRQDGTSLFVFEHKDEQPVWFGSASSIETKCAGKPCRIVESAGNLAVTWKNKGRQLTLIGAKDITEVSKWIESLSM